MISKEEVDMLAEELKITRPKSRSSHSGKQWCSDVSAIARICEIYSNNFDRSRFMGICGFTLQWM